MTSSKFPYTFSHPWILKPTASDAQNFLSICGWSQPIVSESCSRKLFNKFFVWNFQDLFFWLVVSNPWKNMSGNGNLPQVRVKIPKIFELPPPSSFWPPTPHEIWRFNQQLTFEPITSVGSVTTVLFPVPKTNSLRKLHHPGNSAGDPFGHLLAWELLLWPPAQPWFSCNTLQTPGPKSACAYPCAVGASGLIDLQLFPPLPSGVSMAEGRPACGSSEKQSLFWLEDLILPRVLGRFGPRKSFSSVHRNLDWTGQRPNSFSILRLRAF